jgi:hypothetical protein
MLLGVCEGGDVPLVYGGKVGEEHVYAACTAIRLLGVLCIWVTGVVCWRSGGAVSNHVYHCRRVLCIMWIAGGSRRLRES